MNYDRERKVKAYGEALERARAINNGKDVDVESGTTICEYIFPELKESEDEKIRKEIISILRNTYWTSNRNRFNELVAWLEKQDKQKPCMVQWKGDNLKEVIGFTGKDKNFEKWFKSFEEYEKYVHEHNDIFKLFNENGSHYEIPVGAWIVKTPDGYNIASNAILKQKSADKIEPTFNVDDWVVNKFGDSWHIDSLDKKNYQVSDGKGNYNYFPISKQDEMHLWTIQDVRDGDVIFYDEGWICIFKCIHGIWYSSYCFITDDGEFHTGYERHAVDSTIHGNAHPATKEQCDALIKAINDAGYEWDTEKKELKKKKRKR